MGDPPTSKGGGPAKWGQKTMHVGCRPGQSHDQTNWPFSPEPVCGRASALKWPFCKASSAQPLNRKPAASACGALAPGKFGLLCLYIYIYIYSSDTPMAFRGPNKLDRGGSELMTPLGREPEPPPVPRAASTRGQPVATSPKCRTRGTISCWG